VIRAGGWGPAFSDEGAGFWIGSEAIRSALRANDAGETPEFVSAIEKALMLNSITQVQAAWKEGAIAVSSVASLAAIVTARYPGEPAKRIVDEAAARLRALAETARRRANLPDSCIRSISGSLGSQSLIQQLVGLEFAAPAHPPARGAILWARDRMTAS
jgi:N-acetylglucosamine kinase-like BadF-type ATPase